MILNGSEKLASQISAFARHIRTFPYSLLSAAGTHGRSPICERDDLLVGEAESLSPQRLFLGTPALLVLGVMVFLARNGIVQHQQAYSVRRAALGLAARPG